MGLTMKTGQSVQLTGQHLDQTGAQTNAVITWSSDNTSTVLVTDNGDGTCTATALAPGQAQITAIATESTSGSEAVGPPLAIQVIAGETATVVISTGTPA